VEYLHWRRGQPVLEAQFGKPYASVLLRFTSPDTIIAFDVHAYLSYDLDILGPSGLLDPKSIFFLRRVHLFAPS